MNLGELALNNKVASVAHLNFHTPKLAEMVDSASHDDMHGIVAPKANPNLEVYGESVNAVNQAGIEKQLEFLIAHGFTTECIYSQAGILSTVQ